MKLAIIIPVYNAEETIKRAILSVDTSVPYEIICINDGSTDQTQHVLTELQQKHPHIKAKIALFCYFSLNVPVLSNLL